MKICDPVRSAFAFGIALTGLLVAVEAHAQVSCDSPSVAERLPKLPNGCQKERISAAGHERPTMIWAQRSAADTWQDQVLTKYGERFARWGLAACARQECVPAAIPGFTRCTLTGFPCATRPQLEGVLELSKGEVEEMQRLLNRFGYDVEVDGAFGGKTAYALERWQRSRKLVPDGLPTRENLEKLRKARA